MQPGTGVGKWSISSLGRQVVDLDSRYWNIIFISLELELASGKF